MRTKEPKRIESLDELEVGDVVYEGDFGPMVYEGDINGKMSFVQYDDSRQPFYVRARREEIFVGNNGILVGDNETGNYRFEEAKRARELLRKSGIEDLE